MRTFCYNQSGDASISIWSLIRNQIVNGQEDIFTGVIPVNHRNLSSLVAQIDGSAYHLKFYVEAYDGLVEKDGLEVVKPDQATRVVLPEKYWGTIDSITTVKVVGGDGTDYFSGGTFDNETGVITLGVPLPDLSLVEVNFVYDGMVSSAGELQKYIEASKVDPIGSDVSMVWELGPGSSPEFQFITINPPSLPFIRIKIEGQADNGPDTEISLRISGVLITKTM